MSKENTTLTNFLAEMAEHPRYRDQARLSLHIAREFANFPSADPVDYSEEIEALCKELSLDPDEMLTLIAGKVDSVKFPLGQAYENAVATALKKPKHFRVVFKGKRFFMANLIYYLSVTNKNGLFNIPAQRVATSARTTAFVVYAFIKELEKRGFITVEDETYIPGRRGKLFRWLEHPQN